MKLEKRLNHFWAETLGCREEDLKFTESKIVVRTEQTDYNKDRTEEQIHIPAKPEQDSFLL